MRVMRKPILFADQEEKMTFRDQVLAVVRDIPRDTTLTYQEVARRAGNPKAARAVGSILNKIWQTDHGQTIPCHRVVRSDGTLGGYAAGAEAKRRLLELEAHK